MSRQTDYVIAIGMLGFSLAFIVLGASSVLILSLGIILLTVVTPISYKLLRYPSTRQSSLGEIVADAREEAGADPLGTGGALFAFSGIDGSGKTTEAEAVVEELEDLGIDATHVWSRWRPFISYPLMGVLFLTLRWRRKDYHKSDLLRRVWGYFLLADHIIFFARFIYPHLRRGRVVCVDRYILDQLVELRYDGLHNAHVERMLRRTLPTPSETFLMDVPVEDALARKDDTQEMLDRLHLDVEARPYLKERRDLFKQISADLDVTVVNTGQAFDETHKTVTEKVLESYFSFR